MSVNIKDSSRPNDLNPVSGRVPDNVYKYEDALSLEEISASTDLTNKIPTASAVGQISADLTNEANEKFIFGVKDGVRGFYTDPSRADDCFVPFKSGFVVIGSYSGDKSIDVSSYDGFENFTIDNFIIEILSCSADNTVQLNLSQVIQKSDKLQGKIFGCTVSKTYNASTGMLKVSGMSNTVHIVNENGTKKANCASFTKYRVLLV